MERCCIYIFVMMLRKPFAIIDVQSHMLYIFTLLLDYIHLIDHGAELELLLLKKHCLSAE